MALMSVLRVCVRIPAAVLWTVLVLPLRLVVAPARLWSPRGEARARTCLVRFWGRGLCRVLGLRLRIEGTPPNPPYFLVTNHLSFLDVAALAASAGCVFVARADVVFWPLIGQMAWLLDSVFIDRERRSDTLRVNALLERRLRQGYGVHFFGESRIAQDGAVHPFKAALLAYPARIAMPVHAAAIAYRAPEGWRPAPDVVIWHDGESFLAGVARVLGLPWCGITVSFADAPAVESDRKRLAVRLYEVVAARYAALN